MAVKVIACPVITHSRARVGVCGDLDVAQVNASIEHGRYEGYLPWPRRNPWREAVSASEAREARVGKKNASKEKTLIRG